MKKQNIINVLAGIAVALSLTGCSNNANSKASVSTITNTLKKNAKLTAPTKGIGGLSSNEYQELAKKEFKNGTYGYEDVNGGKSTLNPSAWKTNRVIYSNLDSLNRTSSSNTGFLEKRNLANGSLRVRQYVAPTGWHYNHKDGEQLYNRGHLIAYSVSAGIDQNGNYNIDNQSGDQNNPKNLFTQTAYANQQLQTIYEKKVRDALKQNKKVIYQATAIFNGDDKMAKGVNLQAISTDGSLNFNVYIYNVQNGYKFNYVTGSAKKDKSVVVKALPPELQSHYNQNSNLKSNYNSSHWNSRSYKRNRYRQKIFRREQYQSNDDY